MATTVTVLYSGQNTTVGSLSSPSSYNVTVSSGVQGPTGPIGNTPAVSVGNVVTVNAGSSANVTVTGNTTHPVLNFYIPQGVQGVSGSFDTANNASYLNGQQGSYYLDWNNHTNKPNVALYATKTDLSSNLANYVLTTTIDDYQTEAGLAANVVTMTSNNAAYFNGQNAAYYLNWNNHTNVPNVANYVTLSNLSANLANYTNTATVVATYQTKAGMAANVATMTSNNTVYFNGQPNTYYLDYNNFANTPDLSVYPTKVEQAANLANYTTTASLAANYQTRAGLAANVATLTSNNSTNLGGYSSAFHLDYSNFVNTPNLNLYTLKTDLSANLANYTNTSTLATNYTNTSQLSANLSNYVLTSTLSGYVTTGALSSNLSNYVQSASLSTTVAGLNANNAAYLNGQPASYYVYTLPSANTSALGGVKVDGTTITITSGVISSGGYTPANSSNWDSPPPSTIAAALDRIAAAIKTLNGTGA